VRRSAEQVAIRDLVRLFPEIEFPEYQREPNIWSRDQKQKLVDSILRDFDIASVYFYRKPDDGLECIDGRQRLNAIMAFLNLNPSDADDNGFPLRLQNEIAANPAEFEALDGKSHAEMSRLAEDAGQGDMARRALDRLQGYQLTAVFLSDVGAEGEFNLQFLRLNLGTLINAGEKLHAMVGGMRDLLFDSPEIGRHPFFGQLGIPTRRYSKEQVAAQVMIQVFSKAGTGQFTRARHFDLQRFLKETATIGSDDPVVVQVARTLDALQSTGLGNILRNRAVTVSVVVLAWERGLYEDAASLHEYDEFVRAFLDRLQYQVERMKGLAPDPRYPYLVDFQRHVTQASVEKPAVVARDSELNRQFDNWLSHHELLGDSAEA
jgi:uncharacterized protein DUF262